MKILHYLHGMPPVRGGGLVKYALDLVRAQKAMGDESEIITPGSFNDGSKAEASLKKTVWNGIDVYLIIHSTPVTDGKGIRELDLLMQELPNCALEKLMKEKQYDVLHVHSMMGLPKLLLQCAKREGIPVVYTTHDYYGLCPNAILLHHGEQCTDCSGVDCSECLGKKNSVKRLSKSQNPLYIWLKQRRMIKFLEYSPYLIPIKRRIYGMSTPAATDAVSQSKSCLENQENTRLSTPATINAQCQGEVNKYRALQAYYRELFDYITLFHYNSEQSKEVFESVLGIKPGKVVNISNASIGEHRKVKQFGEKLKIGFIGRDSFKGFEILKQALDKLYQDGCTDFECQIYNNTKQKLPDYFRLYPPYGSSQAEEVFDRMDVLVLPSIWKETFGMVVPEALSYGVPVILSENVGAKDLLRENMGAGIVISPTVEALASVLKEIYRDRGMLKSANAEICKWEHSFAYQGQILAVNNLYVEAGKNRGENKNET